MEIRPPGKGGYPGIARREASSLGRKRIVGSAGADDDPVRVVARLFWKQELSRENGTGF
jgi:hypothetical protein